MGLSPFDHPVLSGLLGDPELAEWLSADAEIAAMVDFEVALAAVQADLGVVPAAARAIAGLKDRFAPDLEGLSRATGRDGVVVPELVRQMRAALDETAAPFLHFGATSQDAIDTGLVLRLKSILPVLDTRLERIEETIEGLADAYGDRALMGRTRMQDALEIRVADRLADWMAPLARHRDRLAELTPRLLVLQYGGAVGTLEKLGGEGSAVASALAERLGLGRYEKSWHNQRDGIVAFAQWLALVSGSLGKIGQDVALMAQGGGEIALSGGGGSSAMPHKSNPVAAEILVALARYGAGASGTIAQAMVHEQERSGAAWTLEWLVLPQSILACGSGLLIAQRLLDAVETIGRP